MTENLYRGTAFICRYVTFFWHSSHKLLTYFSAHSNSSDHLTSPRFTLEFKQVFKTNVSLIISTLAQARPTKLKILDAAEELFAENGFSETSLRQITKKAEVNLASVNYHFGSKKELIRAVLERYLKVLVPQIAGELTTLQRKAQAPSMEEVFSVFIGPILSLDQQRKNGTSILLQLLGRGYTDSQGHLRWFFVTHYGDVLNTFVGMVQKANPKLSMSEIFWRLHFSLGSFVFAVSSSAALMDISKVDFNQTVTVEGVIRRIIPFIAAGVGAPQIN